MSADDDPIVTLPPEHGGTIAQAERAPLSAKDYVRDGRTIDSLRWQLECVHDLLSWELRRIGDWLAVGAWADKPGGAFISVSDHMNEARYLLGEIEEVTARTDRGKA